MLLAAWRNHRIPADGAPRGEIARGKGYGKKEHSKSRKNREIHADDAEDEAGHGPADGERNRQRNRQADSRKLQSLAENQFHQIARVRRGTNTAEPARASTSCSPT